MERVFHFLESVVICLRSVSPAVSETDKKMLDGLIEFGEICMRRLPQYFPELQPLAEGINYRAHTVELEE